MRKLRIAAVGAAITAVVGAVATAGSAGALGVTPAPEDWPVAGHDIHNTRNAESETTLTPDNVQNLKPRWTYTTQGNVSATPTVVDGVSYFPDWGGRLHAVDNTTGQAKWSKPISDYSDIAGDVSRTSPAYWNGSLLFGQGTQKTASRDGGFIMSANAQTGARLWKTRVDADPHAIITSSPVVHDGVAYVGIASKAETTSEPITFRGSVVALDAATGKVLWKTYLVPQGYTGGPVWSSTPVVDENRGRVYITTGNNYSVPDGVCKAPDETGCTQPSPDNHINAIVSLDLSSGKVDWAEHTMSADAWTIPMPEPKGPDYDFGSGPNLFTATVDGKRTQLLGAGQKSGVYWALNPSTGDVVWQTQVGPGGTLGGMQWGQATDGKRIYAQITNNQRKSVEITSVTGEKSTITSGFFAAVDAATGKILWQTADPKGDLDMGYVSSANGVMYAGSLSGDMYAIDGATGQIKWSFPSGGAVVGGAAIVDGNVYWGSGYHLPTSSPNNKFYAFSLNGA